MKLFFSRNYNPRLAVAAARQMGASVTFEFASPFDPAHADRFLALNPNRSVPILLEDDGRSTWEADAIALRLSEITGSDYFPTDGRLVDIIRWLSWGYWNFVRACDAVHFERVTKRRYDIGPTDEDRVTEGLAEFKSSTAILSQALEGRDWLVGDAPSHADFRLACVLPFADIAGLPLESYPVLAAWHDRLLGLPAWSDPFVGLDAPELPPIRP